MTEDKTHTQSYLLNELGTRSVTIYPSKAAVVRDIGGVVIKPGRNEIIIYNLTPFADEKSIKVEGHNTTALITDMTITSVPFQRNINSLVSELTHSRIYDISSDFSSDSEPETPPEKYPEIKAVDKEISQLEMEIEDIHWSDSTAKAELELLENYCKTQSGVTCEHLGLGTLEGYLKGLRSKREEFQKQKNLALKQFADVTEKLEGKRAERERLLKARRKAGKREHQEKVYREEQREAQRIKKRCERREMPKNFYRVNITIESQSLPASTQKIKSSISTGKPKTASDDEIPDPSSGPSLRISYIVENAFWTPHYDLRLDTTGNTGVLTYKAEFTNKTGETWKDAVVTLSTSQTSFRGLEDKVPTISEWRVGLQKKLLDWVDEGLYSQFEKPAAAVKTLRIQDPKPPSPFWGKRARAAKSPSSATITPSRLYEPSFASATFTTTTSSRPVAVPMSALAYSMQARSTASEKMTPMIDRDRSDSTDTSESIETLPHEPPSRMGQATTTSDRYGLTTTFELPGPRTVISSNTTRRHAITEIHLSKVIFSHIIVPKYRPAAFLKAQVTNTSDTISLLEGTIGLTLDGSFMGNTTLPMTSAGESFELGLGVDEAVLVTYAKPTKKVSSQGMMRKENVILYTRSCVVKNNRSGPVKIKLIDQVPVSEDERLKIVVTNPKGLRAEADSGIKVGGGGGLEDITPLPTRTMSLRNSMGGGGGRSSSVKDKAWGSGSVKMKKDGTVKWVVEVEPGKEWNLGLEWECRLPDGEGVVCQS